MSIASESNIVTSSSQAPPRSSGELTPDPQGSVEHMLGEVARDAAKMGELLDRLRTARLWLPLPEDGTPAVNGTDVNLPTVSYLGSDFVPAYSSAELLFRLAVPDGSTQAGTQPPHAVVRAADLARLLPPTVGIALNAGAQQSVPIYPQGVAYLAADRAATRDDPESPGGTREDDARARAAATPANLRTPPGADDGVSLGPLPAEAQWLTERLRPALAAVPAASRASAGWLAVELAGEGLVLSVTLDDPADVAARDAVAGAVERAVAAWTADVGFPIDVTFPGEYEPDRIDTWMSAHAHPFYQR